MSGMNRIISNSCNTDKCHGICCTFLNQREEGKFDEDYKDFLRYHNIEIIEKLVYVNHKPKYITYLKYPLKCNNFDEISFKCKIYENRPHWCKINGLNKSVFVPKGVCVLDA